MIIIHMNLQLIIQSLSQFFYEFQKANINDPFPTIAYLRLKNSSHIFKNALHQEIAVLPNDVKLIEYDQRKYVQIQKKLSCA